MSDHPFGFVTVIDGPAYLRYASLFLKLTFSCGITARLVSLVGARGGRICGVPVLFEDFRDAFSGTPSRSRQWSDRRRLEIRPGSRDAGRRPADGTFRVAAVLRRPGRGQPDLADTLAEMDAAR